MSKTPEIRFEGFTDPWEQRKLGELVTIERGGSPRPIDAYITDAKDGLNWIKIGDAPEQGRYITHTEEKIKPSGLLKTRQVFPGDLILSNSMSFGKPYIMAISGCIHDGWLLIRNSKNVFDLKFLCHMLGTEHMLTQYRQLAAGSTVNNLNKELVSNAVVKVPEKREQEKIGALLENIDSAITLHQRKYEKLVAFKASMLTKMFPKDGENEPEIRFDGFTEPWKKVTFSSLYVINDERNKDLIGYEKTISIATMTYNANGNGAAGSSLSNYKVLRTGDIAFEGHTNKEFRYGRFVLNDLGEGVMSPRFSTLRPIHPMPVQFWKYYIHDESVMSEKLVRCTKAGTMMNELVPQDFLVQTILVPIPAEQEAIGTYLKQLDDVIAIQYRKVEKLRNFKSAMLNKMFVSDSAEQEG